MTKEEAINVLLKVRPCIIDKAQEDALDLAIEALSEPSLPSNLDEAAFAYEDSSEYPPANQEEERMVYDAFKAGAEWQKEQMMKEAICGNVYPDDKEIWCSLDRFPELKEGDKVRIIIIKEDSHE